MTDDLGPKRSAFQIGLGAAVVLLGLVAVVVALGLTLRHYPVQAPSGNQAGSDRSSAVVAVLTPVGAVIAGIVGLYFGLSSSGSTRAQQLRTTAEVAHSATEAAKSAQLAQSALAESSGGTG
jgi:hypothetical protein